MSLKVRKRCRVLRKGRVRGDKEDFKHHSSFKHNKYRKYQEETVIRLRLNEERF